MHKNCLSILAAVGVFTSLCATSLHANQVVPLKSGSITLSNFACSYSGNTQEPTSGTTGMHGDEYLWSESNTYAIEVSGTWDTLTFTVHGAWADVGSRAWHYPDPVYGGLQYGSYSFDWTTSFTDAFTADHLLLSFSSSQPGGWAMPLSTGTVSGHVDGNLNPGTWIDFSLTVVPEPSSILALLTGLVGISGVTIRRRK